MKEYLVHLLVKLEDNKDLTGNIVDDMAKAAEVVLCEQTGGAIDRKVKVGCTLWEEIS